MRILHNASKLRKILRKDYLAINTLSYSATANRKVEAKDVFKASTNDNTSYASSRSDFPLMSKNIREILAERATINKPCYEFPHQGVTLTYKDLNEQVNVAAQNLLDMGFVKGDRIAIILPNIKELAVTYFAASRVGLIVTMLNPGYQIVELEYMLRKSGAKGVVMYDSFRTLNHLEIVRKICPELDSSIAGELEAKRLPNLKHVFILQSPFNAEKMLYKGTWEYSKISESQSNAVSHELPYLELDDPNLILFTSGTTGKPKGALMTHGSLLNSVNLSTRCAGIDFKKDSVCNPIPFFHIYGFSTGLLGPMITGEDGKTVFPFFFPETLSTIKAIEKFQCNYLRGTPTQFIDILNHPDRKKYDITGLKNAIIAGSTVPVDLLAKMREELNVDDVFVGYGMTETSLCHSQTTRSDKLKGDVYAYESCGRGLPFTESKIVDVSTGRIQPLNTDGELHIRGPHIIKAYWEDPEKTADAIDKNGWLKTGDIFQMDSEGYLYFKSRNKDIIIRGGANIYPAEIETYLRTHPDIVGAEAFGVPDERLGEEICVWIILKKGSTTNVEDVRSFCKGNITHFKIPRYIKFVDQFPINANNKVLKNKMQEEAIKEYKL